jgi:hypothetical protein
LTDVFPGSASSAALVIGALNGRVFFSATHPLYGRELWSWPGPLPGDVNDDGRVDLAEFGLLKAHFGQPGGFGQGDLNRDGRVDLADFGLLKQNFGSSGATRAPSLPSLETISMGHSAVGLSLAMMDHQRRLVAERAADSVWEELGLEAAKSPLRP